MLINKTTAILTSKITLVPYEAHHVPTYHAWMQDTDLQKATASDPLTLPEEYAMQRSWRQDHDKLTFISCLPLPSISIARVVAGKDDAPSRMLGDVNLFLSSPAPEDGECLDSKGQGDAIGEIELMIARPELQGKGYGKATLLAFLKYVAAHEEEILRECVAGGEGKVTLQYLRVKIGKENGRSIGLFGSLGFEEVGEGPNYFGEVEMRMEGWRERMEEQGVEGWREGEYWGQDEGGGEEA